MELKEIYSLFQSGHSMTTDSRDCPAGSIFIALKGDTFDGNRYAQQAIDKGCSLAIVDEAEYATSEQTVLVDNCLETLRALALLHRRTMGTPIVGITGTNGKTTTKELTAAVLAKRYRTMATEGNFNNEIGVPKTLLRLTRDVEVAVVEMGASHPGDIKRLVDIVEPNCGLITNCGRAHLQGFGSYEGVVNTKCELYDFLRQHPQTTVFVNAADATLTARAVGMTTELYGLEGENRQVEGEILGCDPYLRFRFRTAGGEWHSVATHLVGAYNVLNMLAAAAVGHHFGVNDSQIAEALSEYVPKNNRSQLEQTAKNRLIVDAYNANPSSMAAAIDAFGYMDGSNKIAILGEMRELGSESQKEHCQVARRLLSHPFAQVWFVGSEWKRAIESLQPQEISSEAQYRLFADVDEVSQWIDRNQPSDCTILIKGSNSVRLYQLPERL